MVYYNEHRSEFERENPEIAPAELTKIAMNKYKQLYSNKTNGVNGANEDNETNQSIGTSSKRKINADGNDRSGIAKLARFSFKKQ